MASINNPSENLNTQVQQTMPIQQPIAPITPYPQNTQTTPVQQPIAPVTPVPQNTPTTPVQQPIVPATPSPQNTQTTPTQQSTIPSNQTNTPLPNRTAIAYNQFPPQSQQLYPAPIDELTEENNKTKTSKKIFTIIIPIIITTLLIFGFQYIKNGYEDSNATIEQNSDQKPTNIKEKDQEIQTQTSVIKNVENKPENPVSPKEQEIKAVIPESTQ